MRLAQKSCSSHQVARLLAANSRAVEAKCFRGCSVSVASVKQLCKQIEEAVRRGDGDRCRTLVNVLVVKAKKIETQVCKDRMAQWRRTLTRDSPSSTTDVHGQRLSGIAFRWVKGVTGWCRSPIGTTDLEDDLPEVEPGGTPLECVKACGQMLADGAVRTPMSDQAEVEQASRQWAELWDSKADYPVLGFGDVQNERLPRLTAAMLRAAAASFPAATGVGAEAISPRALLRLPDEMLDELAQLLDHGRGSGRLEFGAATRPSQGRRRLQAHRALSHNHSVVDALTEHMRSRMGGVHCGTRALRIAGNGCAEGCLA